MRKSVNLTEGNIKKQLKELTIPMIFGMLGIVAFNMADTYFVGRLGTIPMAALTFTFPVVLVINSINHGLGVGTSTVISKAIGEKNEFKVKRLASDSLSLGVIFSIIALIIGELTIEPLFTLLGANDEVLPYIVKYMRIWYAGAPFVVIPMIGNNAIRALGDTKTPSMVMMFSAMLNIILDVIFIFGFGVIPALGVTGAALATVISRMLTFLFALYVLGIREKVISFKNVNFNQIVKSWKEILVIGLPNAISKMIIPLGTGIITGLIASFGTVVVAGYGIATRIEFFAMAPVLSLSSVFPVFIGQNFGAKKIDRIFKGISSSINFSILYGIGLYILLFIVARPISYIFTKDEQVSNLVVMYLRIVPLGYMFHSINQVIIGAFNALHHPVKASLINVIQMLIIYIPLAKIFSKVFGIIGIFISLICSYFIVSFPSYFILKKTINVISEEEYK